MTLLAVRDLFVDFFTATRTIHAVRGVSFDVASSERVGLVGESGSGKTTTALALMRMVKPPGKVVGGQAHLDAVDLLALNAREIREARLRLLFYVPPQIGCDLIMISPDMGLMAQVVDRVIVMQDGRIVEDAPVRELFGRPRHAYSRMLIESVPSLDNRTERPVRMRPAAVPERPVTQPLLAFHNVTKTFGGGLFAGPARTALQACSFQLTADHPQITSVVGQSGSGKTTMARMILGLEQPSSGSVLYRGAPLSGLSGKATRDYHREVQTIFQDPYGSFNPFYKVDRTLAQPIIQFGIATDRRAIYAAMEACGAVGLAASEVLGRFPHELSGGQRQRLMVARALALRPSLIVADEPVSMVDASLRLTILGSMQALKTKHSISIIYITHDLATAYHVSDYVLVLHEGRIVEAGIPDDVIKRPGHPYTQTLVGAIPWPDPDRTLRGGGGTAMLRRGRRGTRRR